MVFTSPLRKRYRLDLLLILLYAFVLVAVVFDWLHFGPGAPHRIFANMLIVAITLEAGHVLLTYFMLFGDSILRSRFPWWRFMALNLFVFCGLWQWRLELKTIYALHFRVAFDIVRLLHNTRQGYGVGKLLSIEAGAEFSGTKFLHFFTSAIQCLMIAGILSGAYLHEAGARSLIGFFTLVLPLLLLLALFIACAGFRPALWRSSPFWGSMVLMGRFCFLGLGRFSEIAPSFVRAVHGIEYNYMYFRFFRFHWGSLAWAGIAAAVVFQIIFSGSQLMQLGVYRSPLLPIFNSIVITFLFTHIVQDWWIFSFDKDSAKRFREVVSHE